MLCYRQYCPSLTAMIVRLRSTAGGVRLRTSPDGHDSSTAAHAGREGVQVDGCITGFVCAVRVVLLARLHVARTRCVRSSRGEVLGVLWCKAAEHVSSRAKRTGGSRDLIGRRLMSMVMTGEFNRAVIGPWQATNGRSFGTNEDVFIVSTLGAPDCASRYQVPGGTFLSVKDIGLGSIVHSTGLPCRIGYRNRPMNVRPCRLSGATRTLPCRTMRLGPVSAIARLHTIGLSSAKSRICRNAAGDIPTLFLNRAVNDPGLLYPT